MSHWGPTGPQCDIVYFAKSCQKNTTKIKPKNSHNFQMTLSNREKGFVGDSNHNQPKNSSKISTNAKSGWQVFFKGNCFLKIETHQSTSCSFFVYLRVVQNTSLSYPRNDLSGVCFVWKKVTENLLDPKHLSSINHFKKL